MSKLIAPNLQAYMGLHPTCRVSAHRANTELRALLAFVKAARALVPRWREDSHGFRQGGYDDCANELEAALAQAQGTGEEPK